MSGRFLVLSAMLLGLVFCSSAVAQNAVSVTVVPAHHCAHVRIANLEGVSIAPPPRFDIVIRRHNFFDVDANSGKMPVYFTRRIIIYPEESVWQLSPDFYAVPVWENLNHKMRLQQETVICGQEAPIQLITEGSELYAAPLANEGKIGLLWFSEQKKALDACKRSGGTLTPNNAAVSKWVQTNPEYTNICFWTSHSTTRVRCGNTELFDQAPIKPGQAFGALCLVRGQLKPLLEPPLPSSELWP